MKKNSTIAAGIIIILLIAALWAFTGAKGISGKVIDYDKIAIPSNGNNMDSLVSEFFGRAPYFIVYDLKKKGFWKVRNPFYREKHAAGLRAAAMLVEKGVGTAIAANIGPEPSRYFNNYKVKMYLGAVGTVREAVRQYAAGKLIRVTQPNVPTHYGIGGKPCPSFPGQPLQRIPPEQLKQNKNLVAAGWSVSGAVSVIRCPYCMSRLSIMQEYLSASGAVSCPVCGNLIDIVPGFGRKTLTGYY